MRIRSDFVESRSVSQAVNVVNANGRLVCDTERCAAPTGNAPYFQASSGSSGKLFGLDVKTRPTRPTVDSSPSHSISACFAD